MSIDSARVVGTGSIGTRYLRALASVMGRPPIAVPIGGALRDPSIMESVIFEALDDPAPPYVDLCVIASNTNRHLEDFWRYKESADVLLIEKPLSFSSDSLRDFDLSYPSHKIAVASPLRFLEGFGAVRAQLSALGEITGVSVQCRSWLPSWRPNSDFRRSYSADPIQGGVLLDLVHEVDYCLQLFGTPVELSAALGRQSVLGIDSESTANLLWRYGAYDLHMTLDYVSRPSARSVTVYGTEASFTWDLLEASVAVWDHLLGTCEISSFPDDLHRDLILERQIRATAARQGDPRISTLTQAFNAVALCDLAKESARRSGIELNTRDVLEAPGEG